MNLELWTTDSPICSDALFVSHTTEASQQSILSIHHITFAMMFWPISKIYEIAQSNHAPHR